METSSILSLLWTFMTVISIAALVPAVVFFWPVVLSYVSPTGKRVYKLIEQIPGPARTPVFGNALSLLISREKMVELLDENSSKYSPIYRLWSLSTPIVQPIGPEYVEAILHNSKMIEKSKLYDVLHPWLGSGLLTSKGEKWFSHRKFLTPAFHFKILEKFIPVFLEKSESLVDQLSAEANTGKQFNIVPYISQCTLEVICESAMGIKLDRKDSMQQQYITAIHTIGGILYHRGVRPWLVMDWLFALTPTGFKQRKCLKILHNFTDKVISEKKKEYMEKKNQKQSIEMEPKSKKKKIRAFLDLLVELSIEENLLNSMEIREEVDTFMFEGHDTTSMAICWTIFCLANNPEIQEQVWEEVAASMNRKSDVQDEESESSIATMFNDMQLLERCIKESLRIYPSVHFIARVLTEDLQMGNHLIPDQTMIHIHIRNIHQNPIIYPEPEKFDPDRFLPDAVRSRHPYAYVPFSAGPRNCIGQRFAMLEIKSVISAIIHRYRIVAVDRPEDITLVADLVLRSANGIKIKLESRNETDTTPVHSSH